MGPGNRPTRSIETGGYPVDKVRPIHVMLDIFLAGPDDLNRSVHVHRDLNRAGDAINLESATKAAANQVIVNHDLVQRQASRCCGSSLCPCENLGTDPDFTTVLANMHSTIH